MTLSTKVRVCTRRLIECNVTKVRAREGSINNFIVKYTGCVLSMSDNLVSDIGSLHFFVSIWVWTYTLKIREWDQKRKNIKNAYISTLYKFVNFQAMMLNLELIKYYNKYQYDIIFFIRSLFYIYYRWKVLKTCYQRVIM